jgi:N-methylhydantoinase B
MDPITLEVLWNRLISVVNEQAAALIRTSFTSIVRESGDLSACVFDGRGNMLAQAVTGTPGHINPMQAAMLHFLAAYPATTLAPGDVLVTNDPWQTSGQVNDFTVITPIFQDGRVIGFIGNLCHSLDIGGRIMGADAREVFEEGLQIPITKLFHRGQPDELLFRIIETNVRTPRETIGDLYAQAASNDVGAQRLLAMMDEYHLTSLEPLADEILDRSERAMRTAIATVPPGTYEAEGWSDGYERPAHLKVRLAFHADHADVDFSGSSPQSDFGINVVFNYTHAYATYALKCALSPDVPNNAGSFRPVNVYAPPGSILNAQRPAAVAARHVIGHLVPHIIYHALRDVIPDRIMAEGAGNIWNLSTAGWDQARQRSYTYVFFTAGGTGARATKDGISNAAFPSGIMGVPTEVVESLSPVLITHKEVRTDSAGAGQFRGGLGQELGLTVRTDRTWMLSALYDRTLFAARGRAGGHDGATGEIILSDNEHQRHPKERLVLPPGVEATIRLPGGGGHGDPVQRDPARVLADVVDGYVSVAAAQAEYGVVIDLDAGTIDQAATARLRAGDGGADSPLDRTIQGSARQGLAGGQADR